MSSAANPSKPFIRPATEEDCLELAQNMRREDVEEIWHSSRGFPLASLFRGFLDSEQTFAIERQGRVVALFGVVAFLQGGGCPWMLGTDDLKRCKSLLRECRRRLDEYATRYGWLANAVWSENAVHIEWIKWLGFQFEGSDIRNGETFLHFHRTRDV